MRDSAGLRVFQMLSFNVLEIDLMVGEGVVATAAYVTVHV